MLMGEGLSSTEVQTLRLRVSLCDLLVLSSDWAGLFRFSRFSFLIVFFCLLAKTIKTNAARSWLLDWKAHGYRYVNRRMHCCVCWLSWKERCHCAQWTVLIWRFHCLQNGVSYPQKNLSIKRLVHVGINESQLCLRSHFFQAWLANGNAHLWIVLGKASVH